MLKNSGDAHSLPLPIKLGAVHLRLGFQGPGKCGIRQAYASCMICESDTLAFISNIQKMENYSSCLQIFRRHCVACHVEIHSSLQDLACTQR